jgi:acyl-CoA synthetase (AMP-forming)/AMP-acid ligase II
MRPIDLFDRGARLHPQRDCLIAADGTLTFEETRRFSHRIANRLRAEGIAKGDSACVLSANHLMVLPAILGALRMGAVAAMLAPSAAEDDIVAILRLNECRVLFYHADFAAHLPRIRAEVPGIAVVCRIDGTDGLLAWAAGQPEESADFDWHPDDVAMHASSGGSTGLPKSTMLTNANFSAILATFLSCLDVQDPIVNLVAIPASHAGGYIALLFMGVGATTVILPKPEPLAIMQAIERHKVTTLFLPPTVIYMMLAHPRLAEFSYASLRHFLYAAAPMSPDKLAAALETFGPVMVQTYGQAEAPSVLTIMTQREHVAALADPAKRGRLASCGRPTLFSQVAIMDDTGGFLPDGELGEIVCRGDLVMKGYFRNPQATADIRTGGWQRTGDIGVFDADGYLYIVDRKKDMIITGGYNVYPAEIERHLMNHPAVRDCVVVGVPDEKWGEAVKAVVEVRDGASVSEDTLIAHCRGRLGGVKTPKSVDFVETLPRNAIGKVLKREVRGRYWVDRDRVI